MDDTPSLQPLDQDGLDRRPDETTTDVSLSGADLVLHTRLALHNVPQLRGRVVRDSRRPYTYRARPADLQVVREVIETKYDVRLGFDPAPPLPYAVTISATQRGRPYQEAALHAWQDAGRRGCIVLPTGAGKTFIGALAIGACGVRALVLVPTIDLTAQWRSALSETLTISASDIGIVGGGQKEWDKPVVIATYDGAARALARASGFGLLIADEVHHLPADTYRAIAGAAVAPYRLGLSATLDRSDGREADLVELLGPTVYHAAPAVLSAEGFLADYDVVPLRLELTPDERATYNAAMSIFTAFRADIAPTEPLGFFLERVRRMAPSDPEARAAMLAYGRARRLALNSQAKLEMVGELLMRHRDEHCIVFAEHVEAVSAVGQRYLLPTVTYQTAKDERADIIAGFREGRYTKVAAGRVWNEGVDVPAASIAIVMAGTGMEREAIQRLGRVLRPSPGKRAILYELITIDTADERIADRRRIRSSAPAHRGLAPAPRE